ncbi:MAG TPA: apolipoprotein N-acyltransferase [Terriglobia bacterium]|nr:apolipoprotein N-acyltransferase [Terriglobia bacterium]
MPKTRIKAWLLFISCGLLSFVAAPTHGMGFVAFFSLIPLLHAVRMTPNYRTNFFGGFISGAVFFTFGLAWLTPVTIAGWLALALYCAIYFAAFALAVRWSSRFSTLRSAVVLASCWVLLEYVRGVAFTGFPWLLLSQTQYAFTPFIQSLDVIGALGLSGVIVAINVLLYEAWKQNRVRPALLAVSIVAAISIYGFARVRTIHLRPSLRIAAVQAAVPQEMKETLEGKFDPEGVLARYVSQSQNIGNQKLDMIVWPETVFLFPYTLNVNPAALQGHYARYAETAQATLRDLAESRGAYVLAGATTYLPAEMGYVADPVKAAQIPPGAWDDRYNSAVLVDAKGTYVDRYDKMHLVPFGEYVPLDKIFPFLEKLVPFDESLIAGHRQTLFQVNGEGGAAQFGVLICYEDADAGMARHLRRAGADFIVNLSNDAWFGESELDQHFVAAQFRAIESRVGILRNGNNGITGIIDPLGQVHERLGKTIDGKFVMRDVMGHLEGQMLVTDSQSIYSRTGDAPIVAFSAVLILFSAFKRETVRL